MNRIYFNRKVKDVNKLFIQADAEFKKSKASEYSIERLYDIVYFLKSKDRSFQENYILSQIYILLGERAYAFKIIEASLRISNKNESEKLNNLLKKINNQEKLNVKCYRDLRDSKIIKEPTILSKNDFIIKKQENNYFSIKISNLIKSIVVLNKKIPIKGNCNIFTNSQPDNYTIELIIKHINFLGLLKEELMYYYNNADFDFKIDNVGQNWYDGLRVEDFTLEIKDNISIETEIFVYDYLQNDLGFRLKIVNEEIKNIEYDPIL